MRPKLFSRLLSCAGIVSAMALSLDAARGQSLSEPLATPTVRITEPVASESMVTLKGNVHPMAQARYDQGAAPGSMATGKMQLLLKRSPAQQVALRAYLGGLQDPNSQSFHKWLTPASYGAQFGVADQDIQTVETWLQSQGFKIEAVPASRNLIQFSGSFAQVAQAFHTGMHSYVVNGAQHYSNVSDPQIPAALVPVVAGIAQLNDFHSRPQHVLQGRSQVEARNGRLQVTEQSTTGPKPQLTDITTNTLLITPSDAATIYDAPNSLNVNYHGTAQLEGQGVSIGLAGDSDLPVADYLNYRRTFLNETTPVSPTTVIDGVDPGIVNGGSAQEALVDAEFSAALAPQAKIYFYTSASSSLQDGPTDAAIRAIEDNNVEILSFSFGNCELFLQAAGNLRYYELWQQAAAQGITVTVSTGDNGSAGCDDFNTQSQAVNGLQVSGIASTPFDIAVGGTDFDVLSTSQANFSQYVSSANQGGTAPYFSSTYGYIPENPWNDSINNDPPGSYTGNTAAQYTGVISPAASTVILAGSGGASSAATCPVAKSANGNCPVTPQGYQTPAFQSGITFPGTSIPAGVRYLPDVSLFAATGLAHKATWAYCSDSTVDQADTPFTDCMPNATTGHFSVSGVGGTSAASPAFAGMLAQVVQSLPSGQRLGIANSVMYNLHATNANSNSIFHDITVGNNSVPCATATTAAPSPNCGTNNFLTGYNAGPGYDLATGLGSVDIAQLVGAWDQARFTPTTVTLTAQVNGAPLANSIAHGTAVTLTAQVSPASATGNVSVTGPIGQGGAAVQQIIPLKNGTGSISAANLPGGTYAIQAYYQGDVQDSPSTSSTPISINIASETSIPRFQITIFDPNTGTRVDNTTPMTATNANYGQNGYAYVVPQNFTGTTFHGNATGPVTLLNNGAPAALLQSSGVNPNPQTVNSQGVAAFPLYNLTPGSYSLTASYAGDGSYLASSNSGTFPLTIAKGATTAIVHTGTTAAATNGNRTLTVELDTDSEAAAPSGAITLSIGGTSYTGTTANGVLANGTVAQIATFTVPYSALQSGSSRLIANYAGDGNYSSTASVACTYTAPATASARPAGSNKLLLLAFGGNSMLCSALFFCLPARRRRFRSLLIALFAVGLLGASGCGGTATTTPLANPLVTNCAQ